MNRPESLWQQYKGKARAELMIGSGWWPHQFHPVQNLEPPFETCQHNQITAWHAHWNGWQAPFNPNWIGRLFEEPAYPLDQPLAIPTRPCDDWSHLAKIVIQPYPGDEESFDKARHFLGSLPPLNQAISFEIIGRGAEPKFDHEKVKQLVLAKRANEIRTAIIGWTEPTTTVQFVTHRNDAPAVQRVLQSLHPGSAVTLNNELDSEDTDPGWAVANDGVPAITLALESPYCFPIQIPRHLDPDPLQAIYSAFEHLGREQWGIVQFLFQPARSPWHDALRSAVTDPYKNKPFFDDLSDRDLKAKFASQLFAVVVRFASSSTPVFRQMLGWAQTYSTGAQRLVPNRSEWIDNAMTEAERQYLGLAFLMRTSYRPGMLLNSADELAGLVHLPGPALQAERLQRVAVRTRPAPTDVERGSVLIGENIHQGRRRRVRIPAQLRNRHAYICGQSGVGKSTTIMNMALSDISNESPVFVIDPHGDLYADILARIPQERARDVILFDPTDYDFPPGLNLLHYTHPRERDFVASQTLSNFQKHFDTWGPRLAHIFHHALLTGMYISGGTLNHVRRLLTDDTFRSQVLQKITDPNLLSFWRDEFPKMPAGSLDPILNKLGLLLVPQSIRNIVGQPSAPDFDAIIRDKKIFLANLSTGLLGESISGILGSLLVNQLLAAVFRRASIPKHRRHAAFLYVDELQRFVNVASAGAIERILSEARKYNLCLAIANQFAGQLPTDVRQSIWGNTAVALCFRVSVSDAKILAPEFSAEPQELLALKRGQALIRLESSTSSFNINTFPEPPRPDHDPTPTIVAHYRKLYARPRHVVEHELGQQFQAKATPNKQPSPQNKPKKTPKPPPTPPPDLDELIS